MNQNEDLRLVKQE